MSHCRYRFNSFLVKEASLQKRKVRVGKIRYSHSAYAGSI